MHVLFVLYYDVRILGKKLMKKVHNVKSRRKWPLEENNSLKAKCAWETKGFDSSYTLSPR